MLSLEQELKEYIYRLSEKINPIIISDDCGLEAPRIPRIYKFAAAIGKTDESFGPSSRFIKEATSNGKHIFGYISYDYKNSLEKLQSSHPKSIGFEDCYFMTPEILIYLKDLQWHWNDIPMEASEILLRLQHTFGPLTNSDSIRPIQIQSGTSQERYSHTFDRIQKNLIDGDIYEINYCLEFFATGVKASPTSLSQKLRAINPAPFSALVRHHQNYLICASPERYLHKSGQLLTAQPIKGTSPRFEDPLQDEASAKSLRNSLKEQTENVMIVDLMRNDLARHSLPGTVCVDELFGIYGFQRVFQMISTIRATLPEENDLYQILTDAFPMGSMTGCPKIRAMELIDQYEASRRGLYSGTVGYITPDGDFDWNVVIRSIQLETDSGYLSWHAGSAITVHSDAESEYRECLLKAEAMRDVLLN